MLLLGEQADQLINGIECSRLCNSTD